MSRKYIDADALLKALCTVSAPTPSESWIVEKCIDKVNEQPTADVVEVRHGEWKKSSPYNRFMNCSVCGFGQDHTTFNYCPHCGAKMDGERRLNNGQA